MTYIYFSVTEEHIILIGLIVHFVHSQYYFTVADGRMYVL